MGGDLQDFTGRLGPKYPDTMAGMGDDAILMYSYQRPAWLFWNAFMNGLMRRGLTEKQAAEELQSKGVRWMLDNEDGKIEALALEMAKTYKPAVHMGETQHAKSL